VGFPVEEADELREVELVDELAAPVEVDGVFVDELVEPEELVELVTLVEPVVEDALEAVMETDLVE